MIYSTKQEAETAALHANLAMDTTYKHWVATPYNGSNWTIVLEYKELEINAKRTAKTLLIAGILIFLTQKFL